MKLASYMTGDSGDRAAIVVDDGVIDIAEASHGHYPTSLLEILGEDGWRQDLDGLVDSPPSQSLDEVELLTPISRPGKILAAAGNYQAHVDEGGGARVDVSRRTPRVFLKPSSSLVGPGEPVVLPSISKEVDWELELAVVIGSRAYEVDHAEALSYVAGYTILNDISARSMDWEIEDREVHEWDRFFDWLSGKWIDTFAPTGPWIVTADEINDPHDLHLELKLNGETYQDASTGSMIFDCADLISHISRFTTLDPGDLIATGTPSGVGAATGRFLKARDVMVGTIEGIGTLETTVVGP